MTLRVSREEALLVTAAGGKCAVESTGGAALRWNDLVELARWHRMVPLLWEHLRGVASPAVPADVLERLRAGAREATVRSLNLQHELDRVLALLASEAIPAVLLKGAALVECVYPDPGLRPMVDLDVLVPAPSIRRAHRLVQGLGYTVGGARVNRDDEGRLASSQEHYPLVKQAGAVIIEFHHSICADRPEYDVQGIWERALPSERAPAHLLPAPEDLLTHVAIHFAFDRIHRRESALGQLADLVRLARLPLDWDAVVRRARDANVADRVFLALATLLALFGDGVPRDVVRALRPLTFTEARHESFIRHRVLAEGPTLPLEELSIGARRVFAGVGALEYYVRPDEPSVPAMTTLRARRVAAVVRRLVRELPGPRRLVDDIRLSRWIVSLRN